MITGWREEADRVLVPKAVCERSLPVMVTTVCPTKNAPTCGPWSAVGSGSGIAADASIPLGDAAFREGGLGDGSAPSTPASLRFSDEDPAKGSIDGKVLVGRAPDESGLTGYELYWGDGPTNRMGLITKLAKTGQDLSHPLTGPVLPGATHVLAFGATATGPLLPGLSVGPVDNYPRSVSLSVNNPEIERPIALMDPAGDTIMVVGVDNAAGRAFPALIRCKLDDSGCTYASLGPAGSGTLAMLGAAIDPINKKLLVASDRVLSGNTSGFTLFRCDLDGKGCVTTTLPAPSGGSDVEDCPIPLLVDAASRALFMVKGGAGRAQLYRCNLDGTGCGVTLMSGVSGRCSTAHLRPTEGKILVVRLLGSGTPNLLRCSLDGTICNTEELATAALSNATSVVDEANGKLLTFGYATNDAKLTLVRCALDGTGCATGKLDTTDDLAPTFPSVVVDRAHQRFFAFAFMASGSRGQYFRCNLDGTKCSVTVTSPPELLFGGRYPSALLHDGRIFAASSFGNTPPALQLVSLAAY